MTGCDWRLSGGGRLAELGGMMVGMDDGRVARWCITCLRRQLGNSGAWNEKRGAEGRRLEVTDERLSQRLITLGGIAVGCS